MADPKAGNNPWSSYMVQLYASRAPPQPLGTVVFEEIEAKAKEKLKANEREASEEEMRELGIDPDQSCVVM